jgi:hypothetical protein
LNTYSIFAETIKNLIDDGGIAGVILPTGIATDDSCKKFFGDLIKKEHLHSVFDFVNKKTEDQHDTEEDGLAEGKSKKKQKKKEDSQGACDFLRRKFTSLHFPLVLLALIGLSDFYFQKVTRTQIVMIVFSQT